MNLKTHALLIFTFLILGCKQSPQPFLIPAELIKNYTLQEITGIAKRLAGSERIEVRVAGKSVNGNPLYQFTFKNQSANDPVRVFLFGQQHGNEPAGKDALLVLSQLINNGTYNIPENIELYIMPQVNPDGAQSNQRRNANGADLNRDHLILKQPETRILHQIVQEIMPHVAVDCHEFTRDSKSFLQRGWLEWPLIMMDYGNNPLFSAPIKKLAHAWCTAFEKPMLQAGINYTRYYVGGVPPEAEQRFSTPECDDARNGIAAYGGMSFIIESGIKRKATSKNQDLGDRVEAYITLIRYLLNAASVDAEQIKNMCFTAMDTTDNFIATNYFWANKGHTRRAINVIDTLTGTTRSVNTTKFMTDLVTKNSIIKPTGYIIPAAKAPVFQSLLDRHKIQYNTLNAAHELLIEPVRLLRIENYQDSVYQRYAGRQIVKSKGASQKLFNTGSLIVDLHQTYARKSIILLEPHMMYGLYVHDEFRELVDEQGILPVYRIIEDVTPAKSDKETK